MLKRIGRSVTLWLVPIALSANVGAGCSERHARCHNGNCSSCAALPALNGTYARMVNDAHVGKAKSDFFVIYNYEWTGGGSQLGPRGRRHLGQIAQRLTSETFSVLIETSDNADLDATRRQEIVSDLASLGVAGPEDRVIVGNSEAEGLSATDATRVDQGLSGSRGSTDTGFGGSRGSLSGFRGGMGFSSF